MSNSLYLNTIADLREGFGRQDLPTELLQELSKNIDASFPQVLPIVAKMLEEMCRVLTNSPVTSKTKLGDLVKVISETPSQNRTPEWEYYVATSHFIMGLSSGISNASYDRDLLILSIFKASSLFLMINAAKAPKKLWVQEKSNTNSREVSKPTREVRGPKTENGESSILWVGNIHCEMKEEEFDRLVDDITACTIMQGKKPWQQDGVSMKYAFIEFSSVSAATKAKDQLIKHNYQVRYRYD